MAENSIATGDQPTKWWGASLTIWGVLVTAVSTVVPALGPIIGIEIPGDLVQQAGDDVIKVVQGIGGLVGTLMAIYGRARANAGLERRVINLKL